MSWKEHRLDDSFIPVRKKSKKNDHKKHKEKREKDERTVEGKLSKKEKNRKKEGKSPKKLAKVSEKKKNNGAEKTRKKDNGAIKSVKSEKRKHEGKNAGKNEKKVRGLLTDPLYRPMKTKEIAILLDIPKSRRPELQEILDHLVEEGFAEVSKKGKYRPAEILNGKSKSDEQEDGKRHTVVTDIPENSDPEDYVGKIVTGTFTANARGFGFVTVEGFPQDLFISRENRNDAMHQDLVEVLILPKSEEGKRQEGRILQILQHGTDTVVGTFEKSAHFGFVIPDDQRFDEDVFIPEGHDLHAITGHKVVCTLTHYGSHGKKPEGIITEILGHRDDPGVDVLSIVKAMNIPTEFPEDVQSEADEVSVPVTEEQMAGRLDLRTIPMVTIDGDDSKDLDDAVSVRKDGENYILGVHIADVSEYVKEGSALDKEALKRGTSVYLADRVIPMLPRKLSNGICSLNHGEDRLALSCIMTVDPEGRVIHHEIAESVVNIDYRMTYHNVKKILVDNDVETRAQYQDVVPMFEEMLTLSRIIRKRRESLGCIDFDFPEYKAILDENGRPEGFAPEEHSVANEIIEDFMILANETVAEEYARREIPFLYRIHGTPDRDRIHDLSLLVENFGLTLHISGDDVTPGDIRELLAKVQGRPEEGLVSMLTLRSMQQAKYSPECVGHFGLAAKYYCHFTSPIRRYPDLQIHRIIKEDLHHKLNEKREEHYRKLLTKVGSDTSALERRADDAERAVDDLKKAEYMQMHLGETFEGTISSITAWGMYVELSNSIEGLVHVSTLTDDYYVFDEKHYCLVGERLGKVYRMSQPVTVKAAAADTEARTIDFTLV